MYWITIIVCLSVILIILLRKWPQTKSLTVPETPFESQLSDINFLKRGEKLFKNKNYKEAEKYYVKAVSKEPDNDLIYGRLGIIYAQMNNLKDAKEALKTAIKINPDNGFYQNNLGLVLYNLGRYKEALIYFENAVDIDDSMEKRWVNLGLCLGKLGDWEKAKKAYKKAIEIEPKNEEYRELLKKAEEFGRI